ncbi:tetratricopeptide repeat protein [Myxococcus sp. MxC21-1]|nr:tetratricopeptide repeat protein [Myxococcus sp. MxC21-1]
MDEGQYPQAVEAFAKATSVNPDHLLARVSTALAHTYQGRKTEEAQQVLSGVEARGAELTPGLKARAGALKAELALARGAPDEALSAADEALKAVPDEHYALFARARALAVKRDVQARAAFEAAVARRRNAPLLYLDGARALQTAGDTDGAVALLDAYEATFGPVQTTTSDGKKAGLLEKDSRYWLVRGGVLEAASRQDDALVAYDKALAARGVDRPGRSTPRARCCWRARTTRAPAPCWPPWHPTAARARWRRPTPPWGTCSSRRASMPPAASTTSSASRAPRRRARPARRWRSAWRTSASGWCPPARPAWPRPGRRSRARS